MPAARGTSVELRLHSPWTWTISLLPTSGCRDCQRQLPRSRASPFASQQCDNAGAAGQGGIRQDDVSARARWRLFAIGSCDEGHIAVTMGVGDEARRNREEPR
jgi:hypothetical protein